MIRNASLGRARNSDWPMPFRRACRITVTNEGKRMLPMFYYHVDYRKYASLPADVGYFHAYYRQERPARNGRNYEFLHIKGNGHYVGTVLSVIQTQVSWFGEGDDLFYVDGAAKPQILGTGSEDYFNDAWGCAIPAHVDRHAARGRRKTGFAAECLPLAHSRSNSVPPFHLGGN